MGVLSRCAMSHWGRASLFAKGLGDDLGMKRVLFGVLLMSSLMARGVEGNMLGERGGR